MNGAYSAMPRELPETAVTRPKDEDQAFEWQQIACGHAIFAMSRLGEALGNEPNELDGEIQRLFRHAYSAGYFQGLCDPLEAPEPVAKATKPKTRPEEQKTLSAAAVRKPKEGRS